MSETAQPGLDPALGRVANGAPSRKMWTLGFGVAIAAHLAAAAPFLAPGATAPASALVEEGPGIGVTLAPLVAPPVEPPPPEEVAPEPEVEEPVLEERAVDSPPPAPPPRPRETPRLPDIQPQAIPEIWRGGGSGRGVSLEEFLLLQDWLTEARQSILDALVYPDEARRAGEVGVARIVVTADADGRIVDWGFTTRTGAQVLDRAIERAIRRVRRLPRFPDGTTYDELSFNTRIVFVLMSGENVMVAPEGAPDMSGAPTSAASEPAGDPGLSIASIAQCARSAADLMHARAEIEASRGELEALGAEYERQATRAHRMGRDIPRRVERMLEDYEDGMAAFNAAATSFDADVGRYTASCSGGRAGWDNYSAACRVYVASGNPYCEAYTDLWGRLMAGR